MELESLVAQQNERITQLTEMLTSFLMQKECSPLHNFEEKKKMPYIKEGTLFQRKSDNRWEARLMIEGEQKTIACCKKQDTALKKLNLAIKEKNKTKITTKKKATKGKTITYTLFGWLDHWYETYRLPKAGKGLAVNTVLSDKYTIRKIKKIFSDVSLKDLTSSYIQEMLNSMTEGRACEAIYTTLKLALKKAKDLSEKDIMDYVDKVKYDKQTGRALSDEEVDQILASSRNESEYAMWMFYFQTGCRAGEILRVKVKHVNLEKNEIFIDGTKTKTSKRTMPIFPNLRAVLEEIIKNKSPEESLIGKTKAQIRKIIEYAQKTTGISFTLKDTRHTCTTNCKDKGIPMSVYYRWFGWADETMAKKVYTHKTIKDDELSQEWVRKSFCIEGNN